MSLSNDTKNRLVTALANAVSGAEVATAVDGNTDLANGKIYVGDASNIAQEVTPTGDVTITNLGVTAIGAGKVTNAMIVANAIDGTVAKNIASGDVIGGFAELFRIDIAAGALGNTDVVMTHKVRVIDAYLILRGAGVATTTLQVKNGATAITSTMAASGSAAALVRCTTIDTAQWEIAAAGTLRVTSATGATQPDATVYVLVHRVP